jgi:hypothetical protein
MRTGPLVVLVALGLGAGACSSTPDLPGLGGDETAAFCRTARNLPDVAVDFVDVSVDDPTAFEDSLRDAVDRYLAALDDLATNAPDDLRKDISTLRSAVDQYKFADAFDAKEPLDVYVAEHCPALVTSTDA